MLLLVGAACAEPAIRQRPWQDGFPYRWPIATPVSLEPGDGRIADRAGRLPARAACTEIVIRLPGAITFHGNQGPFTTSVTTNLEPGSYAIRYQPKTRSFVITPLASARVVLTVYVSQGDPLEPVYQAYLASMTADVPLRVEDGRALGISAAIDIAAMPLEQALALLAEDSQALALLEQESWKAWVTEARKLGFGRAAADSVSAQALTQLIVRHRELAGIVPFQPPSTAEVMHRRIGTQAWNQLAPWERDVWQAYIAKHGNQADVTDDNPDIHITGDIALGMALHMVPAYVAPGMRDAVNALITDPLFVGTTIAAVTVYFAMMVAPEPLITKATAVLTTIGLVSLVGVAVLDIVEIAHAWIALRDEAAQARSMAELEAAAERFGRSLSATAVRILAGVFMSHATQAAVRHALVRVPAAPARAAAPKAPAGPTGSSALPASRAVPASRAESRLVIAIRNGKAVMAKGTGAITTVRRHMRGQGAGSATAAGKASPAAGSATTAGKPSPASPAGSNAAGLAGGPVRSFPSFRAFKHAMGPAGPGKQWHHIVPQHKANVKRFGPHAIHNTENIIAIDKTIHQQINGHYASKTPRSRPNVVREWLRTQSFEVQREYGLDVLRIHGVIP